MEISNAANEKPCRLSKVDFITLQKQLSSDKNSAVKKKLEETNSLPNLHLISEGKHDIEESSPRDKSLPSIQLLSRATANALRQLFDHKEKQAAW